MTGSEMASNGSWWKTVYATTLNCEVMMNLKKWLLNDRFLRISARPLSIGLNRLRNQYRRFIQKNAGYWREKLLFFVILFCVKSKWRRCGKHRLNLQFSHHRLITNTKYRLKWVYAGVHIENTPHILASSVCAPDSLFWTRPWINVILSFLVITSVM